MNLFDTAGSLFIVATASTKTMVPLRILAIVANCFLAVVYGVQDLWLPCLLQVIALPINAWRLYQMVVLTRQVRAAVGDGLSMDWLRPFMKSKHFRKGDILFAKGEPAGQMFCTVTGSFRLIELGLDVKPGQVVGELAMLAPDNRRTATLECIADGEALSITYDEVEQLYYQNPTFGFYFLRLTTARLFENIERMEAELARHHAARA
jgi:hypothetical protein